MSINNTSCSTSICRVDPSSRTAPLSIEWLHVSDGTAVQQHLQLLVLHPLVQSNSTAITHHNDHQEACISTNDNSFLPCICSSRILQAGKLPSRSSELLLHASSQVLASAITRPDRTGQQHSHYSHTANAQAEASPMQPAARSMYEHQDSTAQSNSPTIAP